METGAFDKNWEMPTDSDGLPLKANEVYVLLKSYYRDTAAKRLPRPPQTLVFKKGTRFVFLRGEALYAVRPYDENVDMLLAGGNEVAFRDLVPALIGSLKLAKHDAASSLVAAGVIRELGVEPLDVLRVLLERGQVDLKLIGAAARNLDIISEQ